MTDSKTEYDEFKTLASVVSNTSVQNWMRLRNKVSILGTQRLIEQDFQIGDQSANHAVE